MVDPPLHAAPVSPAATLPAVAPALSTFLLTDIEGSTRLWEDQPEAMGRALAVHDRLLREAIAHARGTVVKTMGDGMLAVFDDAAAAVDAALTAQRALRDEPWGATGPLKVRMAIHSGTAESREGDFFGQALNRDARILAIGHGGQVLLSAVAAGLARRSVPADILLLDLGSHRLRDLDRPEQIFQVAASGLPSSFPPLRSVSAKRSNLPVPLTSFVGREAECLRLEAFLEQSRLVTLVGTGGTGKTRLMLEVAGRVASRFADGVWLAELAPLADPGEIGPEIARALGVSEVPGRPALDLVVDFLATKDLLLVLDNAEHLIDGVARVAERLLGAAPGLRILTTSREALAVPGEAVVQVPSLRCPAAPSAQGGGTDEAVDLEAVASTEAVRLFVERATAVEPAFVLTPSNVAPIGEICRRLDGIPLAIELAAGRVSAMSPEEIAVGLGDRFRLLTGGRRTSVPRQQTLHALIDWSWDLLSDPDRQLLRRLSVFAGGWTAPAAAQVTTDGEPSLMDTIDGLTRLVDRSLVIADRGAVTRYRMLETIRQYARERLISSGEAPATSDRHLAYYAALAAQASPELRGPSMVDWLDRLDAEIENLGIALEWSLEGEPDTAIILTTHLLDYWVARSPSPENQARVVTAVEMARRVAVDRAAATPEQRIAAVRLMGKAALSWALSGGGMTAIDWGAEAMAIAPELDSPQATIDANLGHTTAAIFTQTPVDIRGRLAEMILLANGIDDQFSMAFAGVGVAVGVGAVDQEQAAPLLALGVAAAHRSGNPHAIALTSLGVGTLAARTGRTDEARVSLAEAVERFSEMGNERLANAARSEIAHAFRRVGRTDEALAAYRDTMARWVRSGARGAVAHQLESVAFLRIDAGESARPARLLGAAATLRETSRNPMTTNEVPEHAAYVDKLRERLGPEAVEAEIATGRRLSMDDAVALAFAAADPSPA